jgi:hypothetical protein
VLDGSGPTVPYDDMGTGVTVIERLCAYTTDKRTRSFLTAVLAVKTKMTLRSRYAFYL